jgi:hypothetical protein
MDNATSSSGFSLSPQQSRSWCWQDARCSRSQCAVLVSSSGDAVRPRAQATLSRLIAAHEILRTRFVRLPGLKEPLQMVAASAQPSWTEADWSGEADWRTRLAEFYAEALSAPQDASDEAPLRVWWLRLDAERAVLLVSASALCMDGVGVLRLTQSLLADATPNADEVLQYIDVSDELTAVLETEHGREGQAHWSRHRALQWEDGYVSSSQCEEGVVLGETWLSCALSSSQRQALSTVPGGLRAWLLSCWQLLLQRRLRNEDVVVATAFDGRSDEQLAEVIGPLTRYLPVRTPAESGADLHSRAMGLSQILSDAEEWQEYFTWPSSRAESLWAPGYGFGLVQAPLLPSHAHWLTHSAHEDYFQLKLGALECGDRVELTLSYDPRRHAGADMVWLLAQLRTLLEASLSQPQAAVSTLAHVGLEERSELLQVQSGDYPRAQTVHGLFTAWAQSHPESVSLHAAGGERWSYARVEAASNRVAHYLRSLGVGAEDRVAVCLDRGAEWIVSLLGVLKAGGVYVPIDPEFHPQRIAQLLTDAGCALALTDTAHAPALGDYAGRRMRWRRHLWIVRRRRCRGRRTRISWRI